ncbi:MAG: hypothetical protein NZZ41_01995 [Candidatus Dojkabacteria bacterium]|nr:hypothetical protein [Candidatus Dojkabacteria bacterium]
MNIYNTYSGQAASRLKHEKRNYDKITHNRLFICIFPPENYYSFFREVLQKLSKEKRNIKNIPIDMMHLTIKFIGMNVSTESKNVIIQKLNNLHGSVSSPKIEITNIQLGFDNQTNPSVIIAKVKKTSSLLEFSNKVHKVIKEIKLDDTIKWKTRYSNEFHISIARTKQNLSYSEKKRIINLIDNMTYTIPNGFLAKEFCLVTSYTQKNTLKYYIESKFSI